MNLLDPGTLVKYNALKSYAYCMRAIITRGLYLYFLVFTHFLKSKNVLSRFFLKIMALCNMYS